MIYSKRFRKHYQRCRFQTLQWEISTSFLSLVSFKKNWRSWRFKSLLALHLNWLPSKRKELNSYRMVLFTPDVLHWEFTTDLDRHSYRPFILGIHIHAQADALVLMGRKPHGNYRQAHHSIRQSECVCACVSVLCLWEGGCMHVCPWIVFPHYSAPVESSSNSNRAERRKAREERREEKKRNILGVVSECFLICVTWRLITETCETKRCTAAQ